MSIAGVPQDALRTPEPPMAVPGISPGSRRRRAGRRGVAQVPWAWIVPGLLVTLAIQYYPVVSGSYYSLTKWDGIGTAKFVGLANFTDAFSDDVARAALWHTVEIAVVFVIGVNVIGLLLALSLHRAIKSRNLLRTLFFAPVVLTPLATSYIWAFILQVNGPVNDILGHLGLQSWQHTWLADPHWAIWAICLVMIWQSSGLAMVVFLAGLQSIPPELDEAAAVDGSSTWYRLRRVTLPLLAPAITINLSLSLIQGLRAFDQVLALTNGGPLNATETLATQVYSQAFVNGRFGYGAALAVLLTILILIAASLQLLVLRWREARL